MAFFPCKHVHEKLIIKGIKKKAPFPIMHYPFPDMDTVLTKFNFYTSFEAAFLLENNPKFYTGFNYIFLKPFSRLIKRYILKGGFLDGYPGLIAMFFSMINYPVRYFKYLELKK